MHYNIESKKKKAHNENQSDLDLILNRITEMEKRIRHLGDENENLHNEIKESKNENHKLKETIREEKSENCNLKDKVKELQSENDFLRKKNHAMEAQIVKINEYVKFIKKKFTYG